MATLNWDLVACGRRGHITYAPTEPDLAARLHADTPSGEAWRCLRCGDYVLGPAHGSGPADDAPDVPKGKLLRDMRIMRLLAAERALRGSVILALAILIFRFRNHRGGVRSAIASDFPLIRQLGANLGFDMAHSRVLRGIEQAVALSPRTVIIIAAAVAAYAAIQLVEAVGLWRVKRWGEYFSVIATSAFIPLEVYELVERVSVIKLVLLVVNIAAVVWLIVTKRLFGVRGGTPAYEAERHGASLLTVERAALIKQHEARAAGRPRTDRPVRMSNDLSPAAPADPMTGADRGGMVNRRRLPDGGETNQKR